MNNLFIQSVLKKLVLLICLHSLIGCGTVRLEVPPGQSVRLLERDESAEIRVQRSVWFWLWGARPISDNTTLTEIEHYGLKEIRLTTEQTMTDNLVLFVTGLFSIVRRTMIVEGNTTSKITAEHYPANLIAQE